MSRTRWMAGMIAAAAMAAAGCNKSADHAAGALKDAKQDVITQQQNVKETQAKLQAQQAQLQTEQAKLDSAHSAADSARVRLSQQIRRDTMVRP